jgi:methyl-accepting chemotaxis protein
MAGYVKHAAELTAEAQQLEWTAEEKPIVDAVAGHLARFGSSVSEMQAAMVTFNADKNDAAAITALKAAEDNVKTAGDNSSASLREIIALVKKHNDSLAYSSSTITAIVGVVAILFGIIVSWWVTRQITRPVKHNLQLAELIASGDLSSDIRPQGEDELGKLTGAMGRMNDKLRAMIGEVRSSVAQVSLAATEIAEGNTDLSSRTEQQAAAVVQTAASMEELTATVKNNADNARHASQLAAEASQTATQGGRVMRDVVSTMSVFCVCFCQQIHIP